MALFLSTRMSRPRLAICRSPACRTASMAVARNSGGRGSATSGQLLDHAHFHTPFRRAPERHVVHEAAHEEDAAAARLEQVLRRQRIGDLLGVEAFTLVQNPNDQLPRL